MNGNGDGEFDPEQLRSRLCGFIENMIPENPSGPDFNELPISEELHKCIAENVINPCMEEMDQFWENRRVNDRLILLNKLKQSALDCPAWRPTTGKIFANSVVMIELRKKREIIKAELSKVLQQNVELENELKETSAQVEHAMEIMKISDRALKLKDLQGRK